MSIKTLMFVVRKLPLPPRNIALIKGKVQATYQTIYKKKVRQIYYPSPNRSADIPPDTIIRKGPELEFLGVLNLGDIQITQGITTFRDSNGANLFDPINGNNLVGLDLHGNYRDFISIRAALTTINNSIYQLRAESNTGETYRSLIHAGIFLNSLILQANPKEELGCLFYNC